MVLNSHFFMVKNTIYKLVSVNLYPGFTTTDGLKEVIFASNLAVKLGLISVPISESEDYM